MGVVIKRVVQLGVNSGFKTNFNVGFAAVSSSLVSKQSPYDYRRHLSHIVKSNGIIDTLAVAKDLKSNGISPEKAEAISSAMAEVFNSSFKIVSAKFVSKAEMEMNSKLQEDYLTTYKCHLQASQERHFIKLENENSKLRDLLTKMNADLTQKIDHEIHGFKVKLESQKDDMSAQLEVMKLQLDGQKMT